MTKYTSYQDRYFAEQLLLKRPQSSYDSLASAMSGVKVDLNPHQVDAALFAMQSPLSSGVLMADEVGLGKTIEAGLVLAQYWAERKRNILLIVPAALRTQWRSELSEKFYIDSLMALLLGILFWQKKPGFNYGRWIEKRRGNKKK